MNPTTPAPSRGDRDRPDYYITPTHDFTQYTKDYEEKYWRQDTSFPWDQNVADNLWKHLECLSDAALARVAPLALTLVDRALERNLDRLAQSGLPLEYDALKAMQETIASGRPAIEHALAIEAPLEQLQLPVAQLEDRRAILTKEALELRDHQRLRLVREKAIVRQRQTEAEGRVQAAELAAVTGQIAAVDRELREARARLAGRRAELRLRIRTELAQLQSEVARDLAASRELVRATLRSGILGQDDGVVRQARELIWKRQLRGLKDIANHALVVEQSAIAPLTMGIIHYKRRREIQEAMTTFVNDEAKHSAVFRRFMVQKLQAKEHVSDAIIKGGARYLWLARLLPSGGIFLAVIVEAIGAAFLEFFGDEANMPEPLFRSICHTIATRDEKRHLDLCTATYNELYRTGSRWERLRNGVALKVLMQSAYGDKNEDHTLLQACRAFGIEGERIYQYVAARLSEQLTRVGMYVSPAALLGFMQFGPERPAAG
jgi:hypothetical protein